MRPVPRSAASRSAGFGTASPTTIAFDAVSSSARGNRPIRSAGPIRSGWAQNRFLAVCTQARDTVPGDVAVTTVTANGFPLTKVRADLRTNGGSSFGTELWYLATPGIGAYTITVTWAGALSSYGVGSATSYFGVDQGTPIEAHAGNGGTGTTLSTAITTVATHALITDCAMAQADPLTVGAGQTSRVNRTTRGPSMPWGSPRSMTRRRQAQRRWTGVKWRPKIGRSVLSPCGQPPDCNLS